MKLFWGGEGRWCLIEEMVLSVIWRGAGEGLVCLSGEFCFHSMSKTGLGT